MPMERRTLVPDTGEVALDQLMVENNTLLVMVLQATSEASHCPECRQASRRIHSRYRRRLSDLPWEGIPMRIELRVRRFFCDSEDCGQQIFTERLPKTVQRYSRRHVPVERFSPADYERVGRIRRSRLAKQLGILASGSTLLRQLRRKLIKTSAQGPRVLGIDDWAWRKGIDMARFSATWNVVRSSICCRTAVRKVLRNGFVLILERRSSAAIAPAYMLKR